MPLRGSPVCIKCQAVESPMWTNAENLGVVCLNCLKEVKEETKSDDESKDDKATRRKTRSARPYKTRLNPTANPKPSLPKGRGRRAIFKNKTPYKSPAAVATPVTSDFVFYKGSYWQVGDIISMVDEDDDVYYAQIRGFLTDQYCEKSAVVSWLLPSRESPPPKIEFDPATYILGPDEELPRKLECMEFIMHAPSDYYKAKNTPYPTVYPVNEPGFTWTRLEPIRRLIGMEDPETPGTSKNAQNPGTSRNSENPGTSFNSENPGSSKNCDNPGTSFNSENPGTSKNWDKPGTSYNSENPGTSKNYDKAGPSFNSQNPGTSKNLENPGTSKSFENPGTSRNFEYPGTSKSYEDVEYLGTSKINSGTLNNPSKNPDTFNKVETSISTEIPMEIS